MICVWQNYILLQIAVPGNFRWCWHMRFAKEMFFCPAFQISLACICIFIIDACASISNPPVAFMVALFLALAYFSRSTNPERITFLVFFRFPNYSANSADVFWILWFGFGFLPFLWGFMSYIPSRNVKRPGGI